VSIYKYPESKVIDEVAFKKSEGGHIRAYLHAAEGADHQQLQDIINNFAQRDWRVIPYSKGGKPLLEVQGIRSEKQMVDVLQESGWTKGDHTFTKSIEDKLTFKDQIKKRSLGASGIAYVAGDVCFTAYGYKESSALNTAAGLMYGLGTFSLLTGGRKDPSDIQLKDISKKMAHHFRSLDMGLPDDCSLASITDDKNSNIIKKTDELLRRYPSELMNLFYAAAGTCIAVAAYKSKNEGIAEKSLNEVFARFQKNGSSITKEALHKEMELNHKREGVLDMGLGVLTGLSGLFAMAVKEKSPDPDDEPKQGLDAAWEKIRERPLAIAGYGYMASTMCHAVSTGLAHKYADDGRRKSVPLRAGFVGFNLIAEFLLAISSKGHGEGVVSDHSVDDSLLSLASDLIVKQPKGMQNMLIEHMGGFLGQPHILAIKDKNATELLRKQVELMRKNPWACADEACQQKDTKTQAPESGHWQTKVAASKVVEPQLQPSV
jgi:hypothetical protein